MNFPRKATLIESKHNAVYINYEVGREYFPERKYTFPKWVIIGKLFKDDETMMRPNQNVLTYFPEVELPEENVNSAKSYTKS